MTKDNEIRSLAREVREELKREEDRHRLKYGERKTSYQPRTLPPAVPLPPIGPRVGIAENAGVSDLQRFGADSLTAFQRRNAARQHKEDNQIAEGIKAWYMERHDEFARYVDARDAAVEAKLWPVKPSTILTHIKAAGKEIRAARKK